MPVNRDPATKRKIASHRSDAVSAEPRLPPPIESVQFGVDTEEDAVKALADAEIKNLWEATEVIDMDKV